MRQWQGKDVLKALPLAQMESESVANDVGSIRRLVPGYATGQPQSPSLSQSLSSPCPPGRPLSLKLAQPGDFRQNLIGIHIKQNESPEQLVHLNMPSITLLQQTERIFGSTFDFLRSKLMISGVRGPGLTPRARPPPSPSSPQFGPPARVAHGAHQIAVYSTHFLQIITIKQVLWIVFRRTLLTLRCGAPTSTPCCP